jgi:ABC-type Co2+ transport system permease subunit
MTAVIDELAQEEWSLHRLAGFLLFLFYSIWVPSPLGSAAHIHDMSFPLMSVSLETLSQTHSEIRHLSIQSR